MIHYNQLSFTDENEGGAHLILQKIITWIKGEGNVGSSRGLYTKYGNSSKICRMNVVCTHVGVVITLFQFSPSSPQLTSQKIPAFHWDFLNYEILSNI